METGSHSVAQNNLELTTEPTLASVCLVLVSGPTDLASQIVGTTSMSYHSRIILLIYLSWFGDRIQGLPGRLEKHYSIIELSFKFLLSNFSRPSPFKKRDLASGGRMLGVARRESEALDPHFGPPSSLCGPGAPPRVRLGLAWAEHVGQWAEPRDRFIPARAKRSQEPAGPSTSARVFSPRPAACSSPVRWPRCAACCSAPPASSLRPVSPPRRPLGLAPLLPAARKFSAAPSLHPYC